MTASEPIHRIKMQQYELQLASEDRAFEWQNQLSQLNQNQVQRVFQRVFEKYDQPDTQLTFDHIELDLGSIVAQHFEVDFLARLEELLDHYLAQQLEQWSRSPEIIQVAEAQSKQEQLLYYLQHGYHPWNGGSTPMKSLFLYLLNEARPEFRRALLLVGSQQEVRRRLIYQFDDEVLDALVCFMDEGAGTLILGYKREVLTLEKRERSPLPASGIKETLWEVVLEYLFTQTRSFYSRKTVLKYLLEKTAVKYSRSYRELLSFMVHSMHDLPDSSAEQVELFQLLKELEKDLFTIQLKQEKTLDFEPEEPEQLLNYFFRNKSLPELPGFKLAPYIKSFLQFQGIRAKVYFRSKLHEKRDDLWFLASQLTDMQFLEVLKHTQNERFLALLKNYERVFLNRSESHFFPVQIRVQMKSRLGLIVFRAFEQLVSQDTNEYQALVQALIIETKASEREVQEISAAIKQILPSKYLQALKFDHKVFGMDKSFLEATTEAQRVPASLQAEMLVQLRQELRDKLQLFKAQVSKRPNNFYPKQQLAQVLQRVARKHKLRLADVLSLSEEIIDSHFPDFETYKQHLREWSKTDFASIVETREEPLTEQQGLISQISEELVHEFELFQEQATERQRNTHSKQPFQQTLQRIAKKYKLRFSDLIYLAEEVIESHFSNVILLKKHMQEVVQKERPAKHFLESSEREPKRETLNTLLKQIKTLLLSTKSKAKIGWEIFLLLAKHPPSEVSKKTELLRQLRLELASSETEKRWWIDQQLASLEQVLTTQKGAGTYVTNLFTHYLNKGTLPWWAKEQTRRELIQQALLFLKQNDILVKQILVQANRAYLLFELLEHEEQVRLMSILYPKVSKSYLAFERQLKDELLSSHRDGQKIMRTLWKNTLLLLEKKGGHVGEKDLFQHLLKQLNKSSKLGSVYWQEKMTQLNLPETQKQDWQNKLLPLIGREDKKTTLETPQDSWVEFFLRKEKPRTPLYEEEVMERILDTGSGQKDNLQEHYQRSDFRQKLVQLLVEKNRKKLVQHLTTPNQQHYLSEAANLLQLLKREMTSTRFDKLRIEFYEQFLLKQSIQAIQSWRVQDWSRLLHTSIHRALGKDQTSNLLTTLKKKQMEDKQAPRKLVLCLLEEAYEEQLNSEPEQEGDTWLIKEAAEEPKLETGDPIYVLGAGVVILGPFLPTLFERLELMEDGNFVDSEANTANQVLAIAALHYAVTGKTTISEENEVTLYKLICGIDVSSPIRIKQRLKQDQMDIIDGLLNSVIGQWKILKETSIQGLREGFLERGGKLLKKENSWDLHVETKTIDILLDHIPWGISQLKMSWMDRLIAVIWRM